MAVRKRQAQLGSSHLWNCQRYAEGMPFPCPCSGRFLEALSFEGPGEDSEGQERESLFSWLASREGRAAFTQWALLLR